MPRRAQEQQPPATGYEGYDQTPPYDDDFDMVWISNMRLTTEQKAEIARLKRSGVGYRTIANKMGLKPSTVSSFCQRGGLFADNPAQRFFHYP